MAKMALWALVASTLIVTAGAKRVQGRFHLDAGDETHGPEFEISKFSFAVGDSMIKGQIRYVAADMNSMTSPALYLFNDDSWDAYHKAPACMDKIELAHSVIRIGESSDQPSYRQQRSRINYGYDKVSKDTHMRVEVQGEYVVWHFEWKITHAERTKGWFLIAADCALEQYNTQVAAMKYDIVLLNPGGNHLPADEMWLPTMYSILFVALLVHLGYCLNLLSQQFEVQSKIHLVVKLLGLAYILQILSLLLEMLHLFMFCLNGKGLFLMDFSSELLEGFSGLVISFVLICLASGWTLVEASADNKKMMSVATMFSNPKQMFRAGNLAGNVMVLLMLMLIIAVTALTFWNKLGDEDFTKFHDSDTPYGKHLINIRYSLFAFFAISLVVTLRKQAVRGGTPTLRAFLLKLLACGSAWFATFPVMVLVADASPHYHRHRIVVIGTLAAQAASLAMLSHQFLVGSSTYARLSNAWESGMLPGGAGLFQGSKGHTMD